MLLEMKPVSVMKKSILAIWFLIFILMLTMCTKDSGDTGDIPDLSFIEVLPGGCNGQEFDAMKSVLDEQDTLIFTVRNDTLDAFLGINYICCAPFVTDTRISGDSIFMNIRDTCPYPYSCYCKCMCYYSWDFLFAGLAEKEYYYQVILIDPLQEGPQILWEGILE